MNTYITYKTASALKDFIGDITPEPMDAKIYFANFEGEIMVGNSGIVHKSFHLAPAFRLEDVLSRQFCEAFALETGTDDNQAIRQARAAIAKAKGI